jgi:DUF971 family protein
MSHEGIRVVSAEQAEREARAEVKLPVDAVTPAKVRVMKTEGTGVEIDWKDGHKSRWSFAWLREACPCATCHEARDADGRMYKAPVRPLEVTAVGKYAVKFKWNDGHESGIYSWEYMRRLPENAEGYSVAERGAQPVRRTGL